jgi:hypothetical protein
MMARRAFSEPRNDRLGGGLLRAAMAALAPAAEVLHYSQLARSALHSVRINDWSGNTRGP